MPNNPKGKATSRYIGSPADREVGVGTGRAVTQRAALDKHRASVYQCGRCGYLCKRGAAFRPEAAGEDGKLRDGGGCLGEECILQVENYRQWRFYGEQKKRLEQLRRGELVLIDAPVEVTRAGAHDQATVRAGRRRTSEVGEAVARMLEGVGPLRTRRHVA